jgi:hypothetical protein
MKVRRTPMILPVDAEGRIVRTWNGRLSAAAEQTVLDVLRGDLKVD